MEELCKPRYMYVVCILYIYCLAIFIWAITYLQIIMVVVSMRSKLAMTFNIPEKEICISAVYIDWWIIPRELVFIQAEPTIHWTNTFSDSFHMKSQVWVSWCALNQYQFWCNLLNWLVNGRCFFFLVTYVEEHVLCSIIKFGAFGAWDSPHPKSTVQSCHSTITKKRPID